MNRRTQKAGKYGVGKGWAKAPVLWLGAVLFSTVLSTGGCAGTQPRTEARPLTFEPTLCSFGPGAPSQAGGPVAEPSVGGASDGRRVARHYAPFGPTLGIDQVVE
jgi:hypothetical protein